MTFWCKQSTYLFRYYVLYKLPKLKFLDSRPVKEDERKEAQRVGAYMKIVVPSEDELVILFFNNKSWHNDIFSRLDVSAC